MPPHGGLKAVANRLTLHEGAMSTPRELGGAGGPGTNPEQLFAAGYRPAFWVR
jgi:organic hydroperoxide reductase OsmC/OhrA